MHRTPNNAQNTQHKLGEPCVLVPRTQQFVLTKIGLYNVHVEHCASITVNRSMDLWMFHNKSSIKPPRALIYFKHIGGGQGLI